jgi:hypothetical protein
MQDLSDVGVAGVAQAHRRDLNRAKPAQSIYTSHTSELERAAVPPLAELRLRREAPLAPLQASVGAAASQTARDAAVRHGGGRQGRSNGRPTRNWGSFHHVLGLAVQGGAGREYVCRSCTPGRWLLRAALWHHRQHQQYTS